MSVATSRRDEINLLRFLLIVGLVCLHYGPYPGSSLSPFRGYQTTDFPIATFVNSYVLFFFFSAVPLLGAISGYLFFKDWDHSRAFYLKRYVSRTRSIFLPMVSWNAIVLCLFAVLAVLVPGSPLQGVIAYDVQDLSIRNLVNALVGLTRHPVNFQFWFLRDLFLTILCTPLLGLLIKRAPYLGLAGLFVVWAANFKLGIFFRTDVLFFFYLGGLIQVRNWPIRHIPIRYAMLALLAYAILIGARTLAPMAVPLDSEMAVTALNVATRFLRILGVVALWGIAPLLLNTRAGEWMARMSALAFFLHAVHWPLNQFIKLALDSVLPRHQEWTLLVNYIGTTALTVVAAILMARMLEAVAPTLFSHLSGGRSGPWATAPRRPVYSPTWQDPTRERS
jgi:succinoglycan biosynthesis protein ExoH